MKLEKIKKTTNDVALKKEIEKKLAYINKEKIVRK